MTPTYMEQGAADRKPRVRWIVEFPKGYRCQLWFKRKGNANRFVDNVMVRHQVRGEVVKMKEQ